MAPEIARLTAKYGAVPPPWVAFPNTHPYDICWRMGAGESHVMLWAKWWGEQRYDEGGRIEYFRRWPPPSRWLGWMIYAIWDVDVEPSGGDDNDAERSRYFGRAEDLGFGSLSDYERDLDDPKWLEP